MLVPDFPRRFKSVAVQHRRDHPIVRKNKILPLLRFHRDRFPRSPHSRIDHHQKNRPLRIVRCHSVEKTRSLFDGKRRHLVRDIRDSHVRRDSINHRPANRHSIIRRAEIRHEHNGGTRRRSLCRCRHSRLPRAPSQRQKKQQSGQSIHARSTRTHCVSFGQKSIPEAHKASLRYHDIGESDEKTDRAEGKLLSGRLNSLIPVPYARGGLARLLPSDGRYKADHSERASDARIPVPPPNCGLHPYETRQSCAEYRPIGISLVSYLHSTRVPLPCVFVSASATATPAARREMLHSLCNTNKSQ